MGTAAILNHTYNALMLVLLLSAPAVLSAALTGLIVSMFQAVTQIQDQTIGMAAKFLVVTISLFFSAAWIGTELYNFGDMLFKQISYFG
jgi:type III secretion protein S